MNLWSRVQTPSMLNVLHGAVHVGFAARRSAVAAVADNWQMADTFPKSAPAVSQGFTPQKQPSNPRGCRAREDANISFYNLYLFQTIFRRPGGVFSALLPGSTGLQDEYYLPRFRPLADTPIAIAVYAAARSSQIIFCYFYQYLFCPR
jgi:hypothetical protein